MSKSKIFIAVPLLFVLSFTFSIKVQAQGVEDNRTQLASLLSSLQDQLRVLTLRVQELLRGRLAGSSNPNLAAVINSFFVSPSSIVSGDSITLSWAVSQISANESVSGSLSWDCPPFSGITVRDSNGNIVDCNSLVPVNSLSNSVSVRVYNSSSVGQSMTFRAKATGAPDETRVVTVQPATVSSPAPSPSPSPTLTPTAQTTTTSLENINLSPNPTAINGNVTVTFQNPTNYSHLYFLVKNSSGAVIVGPYNADDATPVGTTSGTNRSRTYPVSGLSAGTYTVFGAACDAAWNCGSESTWRSATLNISAATPASTVTPTPTVSQTTAPNTLSGEAISDFSTILPVFDGVASGDSIKLSASLKQGFLGRVITAGSLECAGGSNVSVIVGPSQYCGPGTTNGPYGVTLASFPLQVTFVNNDNAPSSVTITLKVYDIYPHIYDSRSITIPVSSGGGVTPFIKTTAGTVRFTYNTISHVLYSFPVDNLNPASTRRYFFSSNGRATDWSIDERLNVYRGNNNIVIGRLQWPLGRPENAIFVPIGNPSNTTSNTPNTTRLKSLTTPPSPGFIENRRVGSGLLTDRIDRYVHFFIGAQEYVARLPASGETGRGNVFAVVRGSSFANGDTIDSQFSVYNSRGTKIGEIVQITQNNQLGYYFARILEANSPALRNLVLQNVRQNLVRDAQGIVWNVAGRLIRQGVRKSQLPRVQFDTEQGDEIVGRIFPDGRFIGYYRLGNQPYYVPAHNEAGMALDRLGQFSDYFVAPNGDVYNPLTIQKAGTIRGDLFTPNPNAQRIDINLILGSYPNARSALDVLSRAVINVTSNDPDFSQAKIDEVKDFILRNVDLYAQGLPNTRLILNRINVFFSRAADINSSNYIVSPTGDDGVINLNFDSSRFNDPHYQLNILDALNHELSHAPTLFPLNVQAFSNPHPTAEAFRQRVNDLGYQIRDITNTIGARRQEIADSHPELRLNFTQDNSGNFTVVGRLARLILEDERIISLKAQRASYTEQRNNANLIYTLLGLTHFEAVADFGAAIMAVQSGLSEQKFLSVLNSAFIDSGSSPWADEHFLGLSQNRIGALIQFYRTVARNLDYWASLDYNNPAVLDTVSDIYFNGTSARSVLFNLVNQLSDYSNDDLAVNLPNPFWTVSIPQNQATVYGITDPDIFFPEENY